MIALAVVIVLCGSGTLLWRSVRPLVERRLSVSERRLAIEEAAHGLGTQVTPVTSEKMPADLQLYTVSPAEEWARDEATSYVWQLYHQHGDWETVRSVINAEELTRREHTANELASITAKGFIQ